MVWAVIGTNYKSPMIFFEGIMNSQSFIVNLMNYNIFATMEYQFPNVYYLQQDNATNHTSDIPKVGLRVSKNNVLKDGLPFLRISIQLNTFGILSKIKLTCSQLRRSKTWIRQSKTLGMIYRLIKLTNISTHFLAGCMYVSNKQENALTATEKEFINCIIYNKNFLVFFRERL
jgi:hypothetical protein